MSIYIIFAGLFPFNRRTVNIEEFMAALVFESWTSPRIEGTSGL
jgi:hypothetical protein